jgi:hypothetical protein
VNDASQPGALLHCRPAPTKLVQHTTARHPSLSTSFCSVPAQHITTQHNKCKDDRSSRVPAHLVSSSAPSAHTCIYLHIEFFSGKKHKQWNRHAPKTCHPQGLSARPQHRPLPGQDGGSQPVAALHSISAACRLTGDTSRDLKAYDPTVFGRF